MSVYTVSKDSGKTLVTTVINANDAAKSGGNPVTINMPEGFSVEGATQVYGPSNEAKSATSVIPYGPLPKKVPYSGPIPTNSTSGSSTSSAADNELNMDIASSSVTVFIMKKP